MYDRKTTRYYIGDHDYKCHFPRNTSLGNYITLIRHISLGESITQQFWISVVNRKAVPLEGKVNVNLHMELQKIDSVCLHFSAHIVFLMDCLLDKSR